MWFAVICHDYKVFADISKCNILVLVLTAHKKLKLYYGVGNLQFVLPKEGKMWINREDEKQENYFRA